MLFALYFGGFGATLLADPSMYFGGGALPYWTTPLDNEAGDIQNRMFGAQLLGIGIMAFLHGGEALVKKLVFITMLITCYPMYLALAKPSRAPLPQKVEGLPDNIGMWEAQLAVHGFLTFIAMCQFLMAGDKDSKQKTN